MPHKSGGGKITPRVYKSKKVATKKVKKGKK